MTLLPPANSNDEFKPLNIFWLIPDNTENVITPIKINAKNNIDK
ncbi:hypothetical protein NWQ34_05855 [Mycoplasmopsis felis]|nr:hypothetical protein [Mycoplasmopsis felis]MCU9939076.1 hypothetical protein [Mycoplasmopsis felis]